MPLNRLPDVILSNQTLTGVSADYLDGITSSTLSESLRSNRNITGGGTITFDGSGNLRWSQRFIIISNGRGTTHFSSDGYYEIYSPTSGTITGVGGAPNKTVTASGINLNGWDALYVILPIGGSPFVSINNYRIAQFTADLEVPHDWILIAIRNADDGLVYLNNGVILAPGESQSGDVKSFVRVGLSDTESYISFRGTTDDGPGSFNHTYIGERIHGGTESSELLLFKGNDIEAVSGPDRIRLFANNHVFDTYTAVVSGTFSAVGSSANALTRMIIKQGGHVGIGTTSPATLASSSTPAMLGIVPNAVGTSGLVVRAIASQTANIQEWQDSAGTTISRIASTGGIFSTANSIFSGGLLVQGNYGGSNTMLVTNNQNIIGLSITGFSTQTANLQEWRNSALTVLSSINPSGFFNTPRINFTGGTSTVSALALADGTLSFESTAGQLFSISNSLTGTIFSVNDISGLPVIEATDLGIVKINELYGQTVFGSGTPIASTLTTFIARTATTIPIVIKAAASQSANLQEWQNSASSVLAKIDSSGNVTAVKYITTGGTASQFVRGDGTLTTAQIPQNAQTSAYTAALSDVGKHISITTGGVTIPASIFAIGDNFMIFNNSSSSQTITQGSGVTLRLSGTASFGNRTLSQYGLATVICVASNVFTIAGTGLA